ncbi:Cellular repressor of E1A-stimulated proteins 1, partial [Halocaridina rubra]
MNKKEDIGYRILDPDSRPKGISMRMTGCHFAFICLLGTLCIAALAFTVYQSHLPHGGFCLRAVPPQVSWPDPPPHDQVAMMARYIVHTSDWASIATYSVSPRIEGFPFANILSLSDGPVEYSSGIPYMYLTPMDLTSHDLEKDPRVSLSLSEAQSDYCRKHNYDPMSPLCARVLLTGKIVKVEKDSEEEGFARNAVFSRHPEMKDWPA